MGTHQLMLTTHSQGSPFTSQGSPFTSQGSPLDSPSGAHPSLLGDHHPHAMATKVATIVLVLMATVASEEQGATLCPAPFVKVGTECYSVELQQTSWTEARAACAALAPAGKTVDLAVLSSCEQHIKLRHHILMNHGTNTFWLGGSDSGEEAYWHWVDFSPMDMGSPLWYYSQPNGGTKEYCLVMDGYGQLNDVPCQNQYSFICQLGVYKKIL